MEKLVIIKLGGGLIAPKDGQAETADIKVIKRLSREIAEAKEKGNFDLIVVSGSGNFGHAAVKKYGIDNYLGAAKVQRSAQKIGEVVTQNLLDVGIAATLVAPHDIWGEEDRGVVVADFLKLGLTPVLYGDVIWSKTKIAEIFSGEKCISHLVPVLLNKGWKIEKIIQVSKEDGVWDGNKKIIPLINSGNWEEIKKDVSGSAGIDVTGGMLHKVEESLEIMKKYNVTTMIVNGGREGEILNSVFTRDIQGTRIC